MAQGSSQVSSKEPHIRGLNAMHRWSAWVSFLISTHLHEGTHQLQATGTFFLPLPCAILSPLLPQPARSLPYRRPGRGLSSLTRALPPPYFPTRPHRSSAPPQHTCKLRSFTLPLPSGPFSQPASADSPRKATAALQAAMHMHVSAASRAIRGASRKCAGWACAVHSSEA